MSNLTAVNQQQVIKPLDAEAIQAVLLGGDLSRMTPAQKVMYYNQVCSLVGLNPLTKPFDYLKLNGKEVLYANKGCAEQLRSVHKIGLRITDKQKIDDVYVVTAEAIDPAGRTDSATGAVTVAGLRGEALANAIMKAETKSKRRVTLSICGLNMLDDTEVDSIKDAERVPFQSREQIMEENGFKPPKDYVIPFGTAVGRGLDEAYRVFGPEKLKNSVELTEGKLEKSVIYKGSSVEEMSDYIFRMSKFLAAKENETEGQESDDEPHDAGEGEYHKAQRDMAKPRGGFITKSGPTE